MFPFSQVCTLTALIFLDKYSVVTLSSSTKKLVHVIYARHAFVVMDSCKLQLLYALFEAGCIDPPYSLVSGPCEQTTEQQRQSTPNNPVSLIIIYPTA